MLLNNHGITFTFFDIGGGDAIWIRFGGTDEDWHNVLIDGGYGYAYKMAFGPLIHQLLDEKEIVDLWIISHVDRDHIGAVLGFIHDKKIKDKPGAVKEFWFNHSSKIIRRGNGKLSVKDGIKFREYLNENGLLTKDVITTDTLGIDFFGLYIKAVSPTPEKQALAAALWQEEEKSSGMIGRTAEKADHMKTIEELSDHPFSADADPVNGSSIALLAEYRSIKVLLLADSHPSDVKKTLNFMGYTEDNPLTVSFMQLSHHGSKANTSPDLLNLIDTSDFVITGNGIHNRHPDKEALVRLLKRASGKMLNLHFPCSSEELMKIFSVDELPFERYNFTCAYHATQRGTTFQFLPLNE